VIVQSPPPDAGQGGPHVRAELPLPVTWTACPA
jgi:hypothetical protein